MMRSLFGFCFFKQKTAYELRISDWSSECALPISRYDDLQAVYRDPKHFSSDKKVEFRPKFGDTPLYRHHTTSIVFNDPPLHTRVRRLLAPAFTPRSLRLLEARFPALVDRLLDRAGKQGDRQSVV